MKNLRYYLIVLLIIGVGINWYVLSGGSKKTPYNKTSKVFSLPIIVQVAKKGLEVKTQPMQVKKINKRGDLQIQPIPGKIVATEPQYFASGDEVCITINADSVIPMILNRNKFGISYSIYENKVIPVWMYEGYSIGNFSFNVGVSNGGLIAIGNALSTSMEDYIGISFRYARSPDAQFGFTVRF